jgi:hypothetical protein
LRAITAAKFYLDKVANESVTLRGAALSHGSCVPYVQAGILLIKANEPHLVNRVLRGDMPILAAAKEVWAQVTAIEALKVANPANLQAIYTKTGFTNNLSALLIDSSSAERTKAARDCGVDLVWSDMVEPVIGAEE